VIVTALAAIAALPASFAVIWAALRSPLARRLAAPPRDDRWHERETPLVGGLGIFAGLGAGVLVAVTTGALEPSPELWGVVGGCALLFLAGLVDDLWALPAWVKLGVQGAAAGIALASGLTVELVGSDWIAVPLGLIWLVGMTNAFNLLDNMDGLAATLAAIAAAYFALDAVTVHPNDTVLALALALSLACVGFLPFNLRLRGSAAAFMGDSGSQMLGFAVACFGLLSSYKVAGSTAATLLLPILILAVPILDTTLVTIVRLLEGRPIHQGGRDHASHRLVYHGLSEKRSVVLLAGVAAAVGGTSFAYTVLNDTRVTLLGVLLTFALLVQFASFLSDLDRDASHQTSFLALHRRRFVEVLVDFALISAAFLAAYLLRVEGEGTIAQRTVFLSTLPVLLAARYLAFIPFGLYRGVWRYAGARDAAAVVAAVVASEFVAFGVLAAMRDFGDFPRSVFVIDALICIVLVGASRFWERAFARGLSTFRTTRRRTLIVGAGRGGRSLLRELRETPGEQVVGFVDDDPRLRRRRLQGVPVLGGTAEMQRVLGNARADTVLVTIPDAPRERLDLVVQACADAHVPCRFVRREVDLDPVVVLGTAAE
jgi:UDP-GlcNAc:undecaprenyl-phosphate/decaprenyl-phosphate GlcNAc-1-phosphate transferase